MLQGKKVLIGITGSIAAYKIPLLVRLLTAAGSEVRIIMTPASKAFVSPLTLSTLTAKPVMSELFNEDQWSDHVHLGRWADLMVIAPLSCNTLAKMGQGLCDNLVLATWLSATCPVLHAPAMDEDMWKHPATIENIRRVRSWGQEVMEAGYGSLASGLTGFGRMPEPSEIFERIAQRLTDSQALKGKKALVTAGPTYEALDPVRFIGNRSSGKMGYALAEALAKQGCEVKLVSGPVAITTHWPGIEVIKVESAAEMLEVCAGVDWDIAIMSAAVADYRAEEVSKEKIKKSNADMQLKLARTDDILKTLGAVKKEGQYLVGFALETHDETIYAKQKLQSKNADMIVMNSLRDPAAGFGKDTNEVTLFYRSGREEHLPAADKKQIAEQIVEKIIADIA